MTQDHDPVNHPTHYASEAKCSNCGETIEAIDVIRHLGFNLGNSMKYIWRAGKKDDVVQDLKKAAWYLQDQIAMLQGEKNPNVHRLSKDKSWKPARCFYKDPDDGICLEHGNPSKYASEEGPNRKCLAVDPWVALVETSTSEEVPCDYRYVTGAGGSLLTGYYLCKVHEVKTNHHVSEGANRPCLYIESRSKNDSASPS